MDLLTLEHRFERYNIDLKGITRCNLELPRLGNFFQTVLYVRPPRPCHRFVYIEVRKNKKYKSIECMWWSKASQKFPMVSWFKYFCQLASSYTFQIYTFQIYALDCFALNCFFVVFLSSRSIAMRGCQTKLTLLSLFMFGKIIFLSFVYK